ncbi:MAG: glucose-6-phosphate isomerase [Parachlamydiales bacterium]|jgi:glucose-6-phosphate isomerase
MFDELSSVKKLNELAKKPVDLTQDVLFSPKRIKDMVIDFLGFKFFYAAQRVNDDVIKLLFNLSQETNAIEKMKDMQDGKVTNCIKGFESENRAVLHTATRDFFEERNDSPSAKEASNLAGTELKKLDGFLNRINKEDKFKNLVQIGIGGSFLGPLAMYSALKPYSIKDRKVYFISNVDPDDSASILNSLDLSKTLFVSVSKSGTTLESLTNEEIVRLKLKEKGLTPKDHIVSVTGKKSPMDDPLKYLESFYIWDYVGGRYSSTSMVGGVALSFAFGIDVFKEFLHGASQMDKLALKNDISNISLFSALLGIWNRNFLGLCDLAVIPYSQALSYFPLHLQQLDMESNGKSVNKSGVKVTYKTGPAIFGDIGTNAQHSFYQLLHQGTDIIPIEMIGFKYSQYNQDLKVQQTTSQEKLLANLFAQSIALAKGKKDKNPNKNFSGNRSSIILLGRKLDPYSLGVLLSYYENKVAFQGFIWDINSFDQEGVQLGKKLANKFLDLFAKKQVDFDLGKIYLDELKKF